MGTRGRPADGARGPSLAQDETRAIYLDHNATTPLDPDVFAAMVPYFLEHFGNPSSITHAHGAVAGHALAWARSEVASVIGALPEEIIFTGSCTEANNLAILGLAEAELAKPAETPRRLHCITTPIEHPAVHEAFRALEQQGFIVSQAPVDALGRIDVEALSALLRPDTLLVSVVGANNEVGTVQPLAAIGAVCAAHGVLFHVDGAQLATYHAVDVRNLGIHLLALSAHKAYGPKGVGALYVRGRQPRVRVRAQIVGGGQERGLRSGTVAVPLAVGMAAALRRAQQMRGTEVPRMRALCDRLLEGLRHAAPDLVVNGDPTNRLPHNLSVSIPRVEPYALIKSLADRLSFSASSACATQDVKTSHVLLALYGDTWEARNAVRFGVGRFTTIDDIDTAVALLRTEIVRLRAINVSGMQGTPVQSLA